jgi:molybdopterin converting factor small subunit
MKRVFVSYSRNNLDAVAQLVDDLRAVGVNVWYDQTLTGGQKWWDKILAGIRDCDIFVFALSPESLESEACKNELVYVAQLNKQILPVQVAEGVNLTLLPSPLNEFQVTDYRERDKRASFALVRCINTAPDTAPLPNPLPAAPPVPVSYLSTLKEQIDSTEELSYKTQLWLVAELEEELKKSGSSSEARNLMLRLKGRDETLAKIATKIDSALGSVNENPQRPQMQATPPAVRAPAYETNNDYSASAQLCPRCGKQVDAESVFCGKCGAPISAVSPGATDQEGWQIRQYRCSSGNVSGVIANVKGWLESEGFDSQKMSTENQSLLIQIKKRGEWRDWVGMSTTLNILFQHSEDILTVKIGAGKWLDKAAAGAVGMLLLAPLAITAGIGAWEQMKMPEKVFDYIGRLTGN